VSEQPKIRAVRGVRDILPPESALWNRVEQTAREVFQSYGFGEIRLPIFEEKQLFVRTVGADTEIVSKEMYAFADHHLGYLEEFRTDVKLEGQNFWVGDAASEELYRKALERFLVAFESIWESPDEESIRTDKNVKRRQEIMSLVSQFDQLLKVECIEDFREKVDSIRRDIERNLDGLEFGAVLTLRPEATASVVRAYIEHGMHTLPGDVKLYYMGPMFRRERPQKGRYRQFYQIGAEVLGQSDAPAVDAEVIEMLMDYFTRLELTGTTLHVNSIGCADCRRAYVETLRAALRAVKDKLGADSQRRIETNPLRVLDSKLPEEQAVIQTLPKVADHLCESCRAHFAALQEELRLRGVAYEVNWRLVRGLDYYTRTTFEITAQGLGSQNAVCGGGRYDGLVEMLGGPPTKGIGFAIGLDRLILSLQELGKGDVVTGPDVFIAWMGQPTWATAVRTARQLRDAGIAVELPAEEMKFRKALGLADKLGARFALIIGEDEVAGGQLTLKRLSDGDQKKLAADELAAYLKSELHPGK
jgi:histidyl-tRNA synthetase